MLRLTLGMLAGMALCASAEAKNGFFYGGAADGMAQQRQMDLQERALELDARDGGNRYQRLRQEQQNDELIRLMRQNNELRQQYQIERAIRGY